MLRDVRLQSRSPEARSDAQGEEAEEANLKELETQLVNLKKAKVEARREARYAQAELEIAEAGARISRAEAEEATRKARMGLEKARKAMEAFDQVERPLAVRKGALRIADAENRVRSAETDLAGLEDIFAEEVEASAKPEILRRGRRDVERAREQPDHRGGGGPRARDELPSEDERTRGRRPLRGGFPRSG